MNPSAPESVAVGTAALPARYRRLRHDSEALAAPLSEADMTVQSMEDASPTKWHLAHTTWFFEEFVLARTPAGAPPYRPFSHAYRYLFNSYYEAVGARQPRPRRGLLTRPPLAEVLAYRRHVDAAVLARLEAGVDAAALDLIELGLQHEQQHQELILTDILHLLAQNPLRPAYRESAPAPGEDEAVAAAPLAWVGFAGGRIEVGHPSDRGFSFDCERPRHEVLLRPFALASRPITNGEWLGFVADGGYRAPALWLSDGWKTVQAENWCAPLYWQHDDDGGWRQMTLDGLRALDPSAPVAHLSFYEADAFARWAGKRLPTECEWEHAAAALPVAGNFVDSGRLRPMPAAQTDGLQQMFGDVWEWTASPFVAYPGFRAAAGALGEYNGKFMCGQLVLRGGSCASPRAHLRSSYRNFFYPHQRWQFSGLRLADDR